MLYFAYGSNLHHFQMKRRCKDSIFIKKINLKGFKLTFRSKYRAADIQMKKNSIVPGALFEISKSDEKKLDKDRFRKDLGDLIPAYKEVASRLGILHEQSNLSAVNVTKLSSVKRKRK